MKRNTTLRRILSTHRCAVRVPPLANKGSCYEMQWPSRSLLLVVGPNGLQQSGSLSQRCPGCLQTRIIVLNCKRDYHWRQLILLPSVTFQVECARHHWKRVCRCAVVHGCRRKGRSELRLLSLNSILMILVITEASVVHMIDDNDEYEALSADLTIDRCPRSIVYLGRPLLSWRFVWPWFTHSCQHCLIVASLLLTLHTGL